MRPGFWRVAATAVALFASCSQGLAAGPIAVIPHRALYDISLVKADSGGDVAGVTGRMVFEWRDECEGWGVEQRYLMQFVRPDGGAMDVKSSYSTWESKAGDLYRFIVERDRGGQIDRFEGRAKLPGGTEGTADFTQPEKQSFPLREATVFPTRHTFLMLENARAGTVFFKVPVFDGSEFEGASLITAVIGKQRNDPPPIDAAAAKGPYWPIRLAFFDDDATADTPTFQMALQLLDNGVARRMELDYGDFRIALVLKQLDVLKGGC